MQMRMNLKGAVDIAVKASPSFAVGKTHTLKEVILKEAPASAKLLLASGLLDGHFVRYIGRGGHVRSSQPWVSESVYVWVHICCLGS